MELYYLCKKGIVFASGTVWYSKPFLAVGNLVEAQDILSSPFSDILRGKMALINLVFFGLAKNQPPLSPRAFRRSWLCPWAKMTLWVCLMSLEIVMVYLRRNHLDWGVWDLLYQRSAMPGYTCTQPPWKEEKKVILGKYSNCWGAQEMCSSGGENGWTLDVPLKATLSREPSSISSENHYLRYSAR